MSHLNFSVRAPQPKPAVYNPRRKVALSYGLLDSWTVISAAFLAATIFAVVWYAY